MAVLGAHSRQVPLEAAAKSLLKVAENVTASSASASRKPFVTGVQSPSTAMGALAITMGDRSKPLREEEPFSHFDITQQLVKGKRAKAQHLLRNHIRNGAKYFSQVGER